MTLALWLAAAFAAMTTAIHLASITVGLWRFRSAPAQETQRSATPPVSVVIPVCGLDNFAEQTLRSAFLLDYPEYEIVFCVAHGGDPAIPLLRMLMAAYPSREAKLLIGDERISTNPKLNNLCKGWNAAAYKWIAIPDSNVLMPRDYLQRLHAARRRDTGLVCSPPIGSAPGNIWAELECSFLNTYQARWQYFADTLGMGFAQGKTMMWKRSDLERAGGIRALGCEVAEDAASTKIVRAAGLRVRLVDPPVRQPLGLRRAGAVWKRQARWARLRRASFPAFFAPEIISGGMPVLAAVIYLAIETQMPVAAVAMSFLAVWYGAELLLAWQARWPLSIRTLPCAILRDLMLPALWGSAMCGNSFEWRGNDMSAVEREAPAS